MAGLILGMVVSAALLLVWINWIEARADRAADDAAGYEPEHEWLRRVAGQRPGGRE